MTYAEVAVNSPGSRSTFCYAIPSTLEVGVGHAVWVPFGSRVVQGIVVDTSDEPSVEAPREILGPIAEQPLLSPAQIRLARWISQRYVSPLFDAVALMLPPGFERKLTTRFQRVVSEEGLPSLTPEQRHLLHLIGDKGKTRLRELEKRLGAGKARRIADQLLRYRLIAKSEELEGPKVRPKTVPYVRLLGSKDEAQNEVMRLERSRARRQAEVLRFLSHRSEPVPVSEVRRHLKCSSAVITALAERHLVAVEQVRVKRDPLSGLSLAPAQVPVPSSSQLAAWQLLDDNWDRGSPPVFLLFGVTGSGKTEIYLRALARVVASGRRGICLVPEIALTPQTVERFASRFPGRVAVLHSGLSLGEQLDEWESIAGGDCDVVIGPRGALFAPLPELGLIIMDEEHEWTYKQEDQSPRYHARDVAIELARLGGAVVILGSATPDIETFHKAWSGGYHLVELKERVSSGGYSPLPEVHVLDAREELKAGNRGLLSRQLLAAMKEALGRREQIILFLNRRGTATFVQCRSCGFIFRCPRCSVALTYHSVEQRLACHRCHYATPVPESCPECSGRSLKFLGVGTQRVEEEVRRFFPRARLLRWDSDVSGTRHAHERLMADFRDCKADILIGTQMIAKGLDVPQVTLAGIVNADTGLNFPDFRAGERTFQLLCQVAGRAGRGLKSGTVFIQTYCPDHYAIRAAAKHDYRGFYAQEIEYRRRYAYPPFGRFIRLVYSHPNEGLCRREAERLSAFILKEKEERGLPDLRLIGPAPAFAARVRGRYRWQLVVGDGDIAELLSELTLPQGWIVDVDPVGVT